MNRKQYQIAQEAAIAAANNARDQGVDYYHLNGNEMMLVEVARHAATLWPDSSNLQIAFVQGYSRARAQNEEFRMESER